MIVRWRWLLVAVTVVGISVGFVVWADVRPAFDAYGWLDWGQQAAHGHLNTNAAPSWKPLTFLFTFVYAVLSGHGALWLWMVTSVAAALAGAILAGRIAYRLTRAQPGRGYAPIAAGVFAGVGVLGIDGYWHLILIFTADAMVVSLCLAAIDRHLSGSPRQAWVLLVLAALGRPEAWPVTALYALWLWRSVPSMRVLIGAGLVVIPALWLGIAALTSPSALIAGDIASSSTRVPPGGAITRVTDGFLSLYELPMKLAVLGALALALVRRERTWLVLAASALLWVLVEIAFAFHGWTGDRRYVFAPAAVLVVLAGAGVGHLLLIAPRGPVLTRLAAPLLILALVATLAPHARFRARLAHNGILLGRTWARQLNRLHDVVLRDGGPKRILACGQPVTEISYQTILAWEMGKNVADVGWDSHRWIKRGKPIVVFEPRGAGWQVRPFHVPHSRRARCARLTTETSFN